MKYLRGLIWLFLVVAMITGCNRADSSKRGQQDEPVVQDMNIVVPGEQATNE